MELREVSYRGTHVKWQINQINKQEHIHGGEAPLSMNIYLVSHERAVSATPAFKSENKKIKTFYTISDTYPCIRDLMLPSGPSSDPHSVGAGLQLKAPTPLSNVRVILL